MWIVCSADQGIDAIVKVLKLAIYSLLHRLGNSLSDIAAKQCQNGPVDELVPGVVNPDFHLVNIGFDLFDMQVGLLALNIMKLIFDLEGNSLPFEIDRSPAVVFNSGEPQSAYSIEEIVHSWTDLLDKELELVNDIAGRESTRAHPEFCACVKEECLWK